VLDNYGFTFGKPKTITVVSNPDPIVLDTGQVFDLFPLVYGSGIDGGGFSELSLLIWCLGTINNWTYYQYFRNFHSNLGNG